MASIKLSETWNGVQRTNGAYHVETCYGVYLDTENVTAPYHLCLNGFSIYADSQDSFVGLLPATVDVQINNGDVHSYVTDTVLRTNLYSPSKNLMQYAVLVASQEEIELPAESGVFTIHVTITTADEAVYSFDETGYRPVSNVLTPPVSMTTGMVYDFTLGQQAQVGSMFTNSALLRFSPQVDNVTVMNVLDYGYVNPYTKVSEATSTFTTIQFAVANSGYLVDYSGTLTDYATVVYKTKYMSADFTEGILITDLSVSVPLTVRDEVDDELMPVLTASDVTLTGTNVYNVGHDAFVNRQSILTVTPNAQYKYGDSLAYIRHNDKSTFAAAIVTQAIGVEPGTSYVRPDTGETETAGEETVGSVPIRVFGKKWGLSSDTVVKTYQVLWYVTPRVDNFSVHRAYRTTTATDYPQDGYYYEKDDFGQYCIMEYSVSFASLGGQNEKALALLYGSATRELDITSSTSGYYVFPAGESAMNVSLELTDNFYPYGITATVRLSTAGILIDYLAGGKGMAIGKRATERMALDIASDWKLLFYNADVGAYNSDTSSQDLISWMHGIDTRLTALENSS